MTSNEAKNHLGLFENGGSCLCSEQAFENRVSKGNPPALGYPPDENNPNGSSFWTTKEAMDPIWESRDPR